MTLRKSILIVCGFFFALPLSLQRLEGAETIDKLGLPSEATISSATSPEKIALGKQLFFDQRLSKTGKVSCATCHTPEHAFSDGKRLSEGINGLRGTRNAPSLLNAMFQGSQFWDGRRTTLEEQALDPFVNPREQGLDNEHALLQLIQQDTVLLASFHKAFPGMQEIETRHIGEAIASFERTLVAGNSAFDRYYFKNEQSALSDAAKRGLALFQGRARCATCHTMDRTHALFTDNDFHSLNIGIQRLEARLAELTTRVVQARQRGASVDQAVLSEEDIAELGRFVVTLNPADIGKFRTPSLRNVALTAPYMHDGSVNSLEEAVELEIYDRTLEVGRPMILTPDEKADLVAFLRSLTSSSIPSL